MDDVAQRLAKEYADAAGEAISVSKRVEEVHERARQAGFQLLVSLDAIVSFAPYKRVAKESGECRALQKRVIEPYPDFSRGDKTLLRSLRISDGEPEKT